MHHPKSTKSRFVRTAIECAGVLAFVIAGTAATQAFTPNVTEEVGHFVECFGLMVTDPVTHSAECGPGQPGVWAKETGDGTGPAMWETTTTTEWTTTTTVNPTTTSTTD